MNRNTEIKSNAEELYRDYANSVEKIREVKANLIKAVTDAGYDEAHNAVVELKDTVEKMFKNTYTSTGVCAGDFFSAVSTLENNGKLASAQLTIRTRIGSPLKFKKVFDIVANEDFYDNLAQAFADSLIQIFYRTQAIENLEVVNQTIEDICKECDSAYTFSFEISDKECYILDISDKHIVFNASIGEVFKAEALPILIGGNEYNDMVREKSVEALKDIIRSNCTVPMFLKARVDVVSTLTGGILRSRVDKALRKTYHKQVKFMDTMKGGEFYFEGTTKVDGEDVDIFALVSKDKDTGDISVKLSPFNINTALSVDFDVLANIK